jgi:NADPH-dependent 2,4-dienoyl-CoA reductase/sulfur reductase-like enzyme
MSAPTVAVGASFSAVRATEVLRDEGHDGSIQVIGVVVRRPYVRISLYQGALTANDAKLATPAPVHTNEDIGLEWFFGSSISELDIRRQVLRLDGRRGGGLREADSCNRRRLTHGCDHSPRRRLDIGRSRRSRRRRVVRRAVVGVGRSSDRRVAIGLPSSTSPTEECCGPCTTASVLRASPPSSARLANRAGRSLRPS